MDSTFKQNRLPIILGVTSILLPYIGIIVGVIGIFTSSKVIKNTESTERSKWATRGRILSIIGVCIQIILIILLCLSIIFYYILHSI